MSEFNVRIVRLGKVEKHPNADSLSITDVDGGYPVVFRTGEFNEGDLAVYVPIDSVVPDQPEWSFLGGHRRIKAKKLRGIFSMGMLTKYENALDHMPQDKGDEISGWKPPMEGDNVQELMGIVKYEPPMKSLITFSDNESDPGFFPRYTDIEGLRKYGKVLQPGEEVALTEKTHGSNARFGYHENRFWVGSHNYFKKSPFCRCRDTSLMGASAEEVHNVGCPLVCKTCGQEENVLCSSGFHLGPKGVRLDVWWKAAIENELERKLSQFPGIGFYGEVYGAVQDLNYGVGQGVAVRFFDAMDLSRMRYLDYDDFVELCKSAGVETMPVLYRGPWSEDLRSHAEGKTVLGNGVHCREGFVVRPVKERHDRSIGRVVLKLIGEGYMLRKDA